jgi:hypothetical protein
VSGQDNAVNPVAAVEPDNRREATLVALPQHSNRYLSRKMDTRWPAQSILACLALWSRPKAKTGHRRLQWHCCCGKRFWGDFRHTDDDQIHRLVSALHADGFTVVNVTESSPTLDTPVSCTRFDAAIRPEAQSASMLGYSLISPGHSSPSDNHANVIGLCTSGVQAAPSHPPLPSAMPTMPANGVGPTSAPAASSADSWMSQLSKPVYLELCINKSSTITRLGEIKLVDA